MHGLRYERPCGCSDCKDSWWLDERQELADNLLTGVGEQPRINIGVEEIAQESCDGAPVSAEDIAIGRIRGNDTELMEETYKDWLLLQILRYVDEARPHHESRHFRNAW